MNIRKRLLSFIICGVMAFSACPLTAFADDSVYTGGLCEHHMEHNEECGYVPAKEGSPCGYWCEICSGETEESDKADATDETDEIEIDNTDKTEEPEKTDETDETEESEKSFSPMSARAIEPKNGDGTEENPYKIGTAEELYRFAQKVNGGDYDACAQLTKDIVLNENVLKADGSLNGDGSDFDQWTPIGVSRDNSYTGTFDGNGHTISGLYVDSDARYIGLFGYIGNGATVKNVGIVDSYINGSEFFSNVSVGAICGYNYSGTITNCYNTGTVSGSGIDNNSYAGGVCGQNMNNGKIENCYNTGTVSGEYAGGVCGNSYGTENCYNTGTVSGEYAGGVCGISYGTVENCYNTGTVSGRNAGGVCGWNIYGGTIENCYNTGAVSGACTGGVCGYNDEGEISNCYNTGNVSGEYAGGVCGQNMNNGKIENCYNTGAVSGSSSTNNDIYAGGVCGISYGTITNCYNTGAVSGRYAGGVCGWNYNGTVENCYYLEGMAETGVGSGSATDTTKALTMEQMTGSAAKDNMSGFHFDTVWGIKESQQTIQTREIVEVPLGIYYPYLQVFGEESAPEAKLSVYVMEKEGDYFLIDSAEELQKFADIVNGTLSDVEKAAYESEYGIKFNGDEKKINAKLTEDIVLNNNVLSEDGSLNSGTFTEWTPIGVSRDNSYTGTFDGDGHTISGLYIDSEDRLVGLFGYIGNGATVKNVGIVDSYINFSGDYAGGGVCGYNYGGTITNCYNTGTVSGTSASSINYVGGICGQNMNNGKIENCYNTGIVSSSGFFAGGVCGYNDEGEISNCYNTGNVSGSYVAGGVCGISSGTVENCYNTGTVSGEYAGGVCGYNMNNGTIENCYNTGNVSGRNAGGVCGYNSNNGTIENCYNTGTVSGEYAGGVCGYNRSTVENCYNTVIVSGRYAGGVCGWNYNGTVENCYYLSGTAETGVGSNSGTSGTAADIEKKSQSQFSSGEVAWLLRNGQEDQVWGQKIGTDSYPKFSDEKVLKVTLMDGEDEIGAVYANVGGTIAEPDVDVGSGFYVDGWYTDSDLDGDEWDFENDTIDDDITLYADVEERRSSGGSYSLPEGTDRDETKDEPSTPETPGFIDVDIFDWYHDGVMYVTENGIMSGVGGNRFEPETELKREMLAVILWNMTDNPEPNGIAPFLDVTSDKYYAKAIAWANENGVMYGYGEEFGVGEAVTREDFAAILYRYAAFKGYDTTQGGMAIREFIDFDQIADYAVEALGWAVNSGIISGMGDGTISPKTSTYRGQAAVMLMKFCENIMK